MLALLTVTLSPVPLCPAVQNPHPSSDKAFILHAEDFADEELQSETFCLMFRNSTFANEFKEQHDKARELNEASEEAEAGAGGAGAAKDESKAAAEEEEEPIMFYNTVEAMYPGDKVG